MCHSRENEGEESDEEEGDRNNRNSHSSVNILNGPGIWLSALLF